MRTGSVFIDHFFYVDLIIEQLRHALNIFPSEY
jgi:hypothetical protein